MAVKTAALIQTNVWTRRNFSSCTSTAKRPSRSWTLAMRPSPSERNESTRPGGAEGRVSMADGGLLVAAAPDEDADEQADARGNGEGLVGIGTDGGIGVLGPGDDAAPGVFIELAEAFLGGIVAGAERAHGGGGAFGHGTADHLFGLGDEGLEITDEILGRLGSGLVIFHGREAIQVVGS